MFLCLNWTNLPPLYHLWESHPCVYSNLKLFSSSDSSAESLHEVAQPLIFQSLSTDMEQGLLFTPHASCPPEPVIEEGAFRIHAQTSTSTPTHVQQHMYITYSRYLYPSFISYGVPELPLFYRTGGCELVLKDDRIKAVVEKDVT